VEETVYVIEEDEEEEETVRVWLRIGGYNGILC
jgi:hypothetical protein